MTYEVLLVVHITAAIVWLGGGVMMQLFALRARGATILRSSAASAATSSPSGPACCCRRRSSWSCSASS